MGEAFIVKKGGGSITPYPSFTFSGNYTVEVQDDKNWIIRFLSTGTFVLSKDVVADIFLCGGGGGGAYGAYAAGHRGGGGGGGGGYTSTRSNVTLTKGTSYTITIGSGAPPYSSYFSSSQVHGGATSITGGSVSYSVNGGSTATSANRNGGNGGSGGGAGGYGTGSQGTVTSSETGKNGIGGVGGIGGNAGSNGASDGTGGTGQGTTTREFGETTGFLYASGGSGGTAQSSTAFAAAPTNGAPAGVSAAPNTGGGGGGANYTDNDHQYATCAGYGGSGILCIRNHR